MTTLDAASSNNDHADRGPVDRVATGRGFDIGLLGIDGIGKSTLAKHIADDFRAQGREVLVLSWRRWLQQAAPGLARNVLFPLHGAAVRALFSQSRTRAGTASTDLLPEDLGLIDNKLLKDLVAQELHFHGGQGVLAAMFAEVSASLILRQQVVEPAIARGCVVIQESYSYKQLVKQLEVAAHHLRLDRAAVEHMHTAIADTMYVCCRPNFGLFVDGNVEFAYECRMRDSKALGPIEHLGDPELSSFESFVNLQESARARFAAFAQRCGWPVHNMHATDLHESVEQGRAMVRDIVERTSGHSQTAAQGAY